MHRQLHQSLRLLCRHQCRRRLYSVNAAAFQHRSPDTTHGDPVASSSSQTVVLPGGSPEIPRAASTDEVKSPAKKRKRKALSGDADPDNPRQTHNKVDSFLASLRAGGIEPTLDDLRRLKPQTRPSADSPNYAPAYADLVDRLCRTFSKDQLRQFGKELKFGGGLTRGKRKKTEYAESIMEKLWGWENLKELERQKRDMSEVISKSFPASASELFLLLGKDGSELLQISTDYNVHISVTPNPLSIRIEGFKKSLEKLESLISERRKAIVEEIVELPTRSPLSPSLLQQISRIANAYIENVGHKGRIRICANDPVRIEKAKRIALRATVNVDHASNTPLLACLPSRATSLSPEIFPATYALFPFLPERTSPWTSTAGCTFRSRKVGEWLGVTGEMQSSTSTNVLSGGGRLLDENGTESRLEDIIGNAFPDPLGSRIITATTGHILITAKSEQGRQSLLPPFPGHWQYPEFMKWMQKGSAHRMFVPSLPVPLQDAPPDEEKIIHRLSYRYIPGKQGAGRATRVIRAEVVITEQRPSSRSPGTDQPISADLTASDDLARAELDSLLLEDASVPKWLGTADIKAGVETKDGIFLDADSPHAEDSNASVVADNQSDGSAAEVTIKSTTLDVPFTEELPEKSLIEAIAPSGELRDNLYTEVTLKGDNSEALVDAEVGAELPVKQLNVYGKPVYCKGNELELLLALPDRSTDLKLTVLDSATFPSVNELPTLQKYFTELKEYLDDPAAKHPEPPFSIKDGDDKYVLESNVSVRRSVESLVVPSQNAQDLDSGSSFDEESSLYRIPTVSESIFDLETGQKMVNCEISCNKSSPEAWAAFLEDLDGLTSFGYNSVRKTTQTQF
ncbi:hypothetical protein M0805_004241 [Coniferiporia weirii]|nr:hypothetical protein M0805_004241 [Coniferiporia weirii]